MRYSFLLVYILTKIWVCLHVSFYAFRKQSPNHWWSVVPYPLSPSPNLQSLVIIGILSLFLQKQSHNLPHLKKKSHNHCWSVWHFNPPPPKKNSNILIGGQWHFTLPLKITPRSLVVSSTLRPPAFTFNLPILLPAVEGELPLLWKGCMFVNITCIYTCDGSDWFSQATEPFWFALDIAAVI